MMAKTIQRAIEGFSCSANQIPSRPAKIIRRMAIYIYIFIGVGGWEEMGIRLVSYKLFVMIFAPVMSVLTRLHSCMY